MESRPSEGFAFRYAPFAQPVPRDRAADDEFPSIGQFLDELPSIEDYLDHAPFPAEVAQNSIASSMQPDSEGWAISGWQSFAWDSLSSLGRQKGSRMTPEEAWSPEPWPVAGEADSGPTPDDVAAALNDIAERVRSGELPIDQLRSSPPEAAMAAVIAAMLRLRG